MSYFMLSYFDFALRGPIVISLCVILCFMCVLYLFPLLRSPLFPLFPVTNWSDLNSELKWSVSNVLTTVLLIAQIAAVIVAVAHKISTDTASSGTHILSICTRWTNDRRRRSQSDVWCIAWEQVLLKADILNTSKRRGVRELIVRIHSLNTPAV